jgi:hypothetical protein
MKKMIPILMIAAVSAIIFAACNSKPQADAGNGKVLTTADTAGLADFQKWKALNERKDPAMYYNQDYAYNQPAKSTYAPVRKSSATHRSVTPKSVSMSSTDQYPAKTIQKRGWSRRAKGAAIGGGGGAILGAILDKNHRVAGGILGGVLGTGLGYVIGNEMDRKHGR